MNLKKNTIKNPLLFSAALILCTALMAEVPQGISHQAVIRNTQGELVTGQTIGIRVSIRQGSAEGTAVYVETHTPASNAHGLITYVIGSGDPGSGLQTEDFKNIDWVAGPYFLKTEADPEGNDNYTITGTMQFLSVPYALYAEKSSDSYWQKQGPDIFFHEGNVGIGTDSPEAKLHVDGGDAIIHGHTIGRGGGSNSLNFAAGIGALYENTSGHYNTAIGHTALTQNTTGTDNTAIGFLAGIPYNNSFGTFIGSNARALGTGMNNVIAIGYNAVATEAGQVRLGSNSIHSLYCSGAYWGEVGGTTQRELYVDDNFKIGYLSSSKRAMENTRDIESVNWLYELKPVSFNFLNDETRSLRYGLIAEEVEKIAPQFVSYNEDGLPETVSCSALVTPLLKAVQEQQKNYSGTAAADFCTDAKG